MDALFNGIADLCQPMFDLVSKLGNIPNALFVITAFIAFVSWTGMLVKYKKLQENE